MKKSEVIEHLKELRSQHAFEGAIRYEANHEYEDHFKKVEALQYVINLLESISIKVAPKDIEKVVSKEVRKLMLGGKSND